MPIYEYECMHCGHHFDRFQHLAEAPVAACPKCNGSVRRVFQPVGVIFKGTGFYATDNRRGSNGTSRDGRDKTEPATAAKEDGAKKPAPDSESAEADKAK